MVGEAVRDPNRRLAARLPPQVQISRDELLHRRDHFSPHFTDRQLDLRKLSFLYIFPFFASFRFLRALVSHVRTAHQLALGNAGPHCCCDTSRPEHTYCSQCGLPHPRRRANMRAQAFMPPFDLINSVRRILPGLAFRAYRKARDHLLLLLASATSRSAVQKITMPNGSGLIRGASA